MLTAALIYLPDALRYITVVLIVVVILAMPRAVVVVTGRNALMSLLFLAAIDFLFVGRLIESVSRLHKPLIWYGTPITFIVAAFMVVYVAIATRNARTSATVRGRGEPR